MQNGPFGQPTHMTRSEGVQRFDQVCAAAGGGACRPGPTLSSGPDIAGPTPRSSTCSDAALITLGNPLGAPDPLRVRSDGLTSPSRLALRGDEPRYRPQPISTSV